jgi:AcrR family transcriptional regulator
MSEDSYLSTTMWPAMTEDHKPRRRQARGERRITLLLDAAAEVFAEVGFEAATTNAIAARAGVSPGSLYQFFSNKEAIAEALGARYAERLQVTYDAAFGPDLAYLPLEVLLDSVIDPLIAFNVANPGFQALLADPGAPQRVAASKQPLNAAILGRIEAIFAARAPFLSPEERARCAQVSMQLFKALLPLVLAADGAERDAIVIEMKKALRGYLASLVGEPTSGLAW